MGRKTCEGVCIKIDLNFSVSGTMELIRHKQDLQELYRSLSLKLEGYALYVYVRYRIHIAPTNQLRVF